MALIENSNPKQTSGGYTRLFGIKELSSLITKIQSTVISAGTELEKIIHQEIKNIDSVGGLESFLEYDVMPVGIFLATKKQIKKYNRFDSSGLEPDFLIFKRVNTSQFCYIIELKDGHIFDTKKENVYMIFQAKIHLIFNLFLSVIFVVLMLITMNKYILVLKVKYIRMIF